MSNSVGNKPPPSASGTPPFMPPSAPGTRPGGDLSTEGDETWEAKTVLAPAQADPLTASAPPRQPAPLTADSLAEAMGVISDFFGDPRLALSREKLSQGGPEKLEHFSQDFAKKMGELRDQYSLLKGNPAKADEFNKKFGELESRLADAGMNADDFFRVATAGPTSLAARIRGAASPEEAAVFSKVDALVETAADQDLKLSKSQVSVRLDAQAAADAPDAIQGGYDRAVGRLVSGLKQMVDAHEINDAQRQTFLEYGISRLSQVRAREMTSDFPAASSVGLGSAAWKTQMDALLPPERTNQTLEVFADGVKYYDRMAKVIDDADSKLFVSLMKAEPDRASLGITDNLSARVRQARGDLTSLAVINRIAAKKLEMPYEEYMGLRINSKMEAKDIRDLRIAQEQLRRSSRGGSTPEILCPEVKAKAEEVKKLPEAQRKALVNQLFTHCDVKVVLDGKFADMALAGQLYGMYSLAMGHSPIAWLKGVLGSMRSDVAENAVVAYGNHAQGTRYVVDALGTPLRDIEDKAAFLHHPIRFAFGAPRDLEDVGVDVKYENKLFDKKGVHPTGLFRTQHEKIFLGKRADGTLSFVTSGNNIGAKHFSYPDQDGVRHVRFHDAGVYSEGGKGSVAEDAAQYEVVQHWNDVGSDPSRKISAEQAQSWLASSDQKVGDTSARLVTVAPERSRSADAAVFAGLASANKRVVLINPFFTGDEFIKQAIATADRWKREGWDPSKPYDPKDPTSRQFIVILPGWLDNGISQAASFKGINAMKDHGIEVRRWNPAPGTPTPDGLGVYDRKAMMHTKVFTFESQTGADIKGFTMLGSMNLQNPVASGQVRELGVYSEDPGVRAQVEQEVIQPDIKNSQEAKKIGALMNVFDHSVGLATKFWQ